MKINNKFGLIFMTAIAGSNLIGAEISPRDFTVTLPFMTKAPVIDGEIKAGEYFGSSENFGLLTHQTKYLASRQGSFYVGSDGQNLYFAFKSELPDLPGLKLRNRVKKRDGEVYMDDSVEFLFASPSANAVYHVIFNPSGKSFDVFYPIVNGGVSVSNSKDWDPKIEVKSNQDNGFWTIEAKIPFREFEMEPGFTGIGNWRFQAARNWTTPQQQTAANQTVVFANIDEMANLKFEKDSPAVRFPGLGKKYKSGENRLYFLVDNPTSTPKKVKYRISISSEAAPRQADNEITVAPGKTEEITLNYDEKSKITNDLSILFIDSLNNNQLYRRSFSWTTLPEPRWIAPDAPRSTELEIGIYPYFNLVKARYGNAAEPADLKKIAAVDFEIIDEKGVVSGNKVAGVKNSNGFQTQWNPGKLAKGKYTLAATLKTIDGQVVEKVSKAFHMDQFEWEHNQIGLDRLVISPYNPLEYGPNTVKTLMVQYRFADGFFDQISAGDADNILSSPVTLTVNGTIPRQQSFTFTEKSADLGIASSQLSLPGLSMQVTHDIEYDNFIKTTLKVVPEDKFEVEEMTLSIPIKEEFAELYHSVCNSMKYNPAAQIPEGAGTVWKSLEGKLHKGVSANFRPYIWIGGLEKGISFFAESDRNWSRDPAKPMAELIRRDQSVILQIHFADKKTIWEKPFEIVFGFQATPCRPQPAGKRKMAERVKFKNAVTLSTLAGGGCWSSDDYDQFPKNGDYDFVKAICAVKNVSGDQAAQKAMVDAFMKKNFAGYQKDRQDFFERHLLRGFTYANMSSLLVPYVNARASHLRWPAYQVFMDEWFCSEYRANNEDDYNNTPTLSFQDMMLFNMRKLVRAGLDGIYYDNIRDWNNPNGVTGPAYQLPDGKTQPYFDIFDMRKLIKRTAVMLQQEGKTFLDGRPLLILHMTNTNIIPFTSFAGITLDLEDKYGSMDFQYRFTEEFLKVSTLGTQSGSVPEILVQISGKEKEFVTRTFLAVTLAYDLPFVMDGGGLTPSWFNTWRKLHDFGYGSDEVKIYPSFVTSPFHFSASSDKVRMTVYDKPSSGEKIVAVSSFGHDGEIELDLKSQSVADFETGKALNSADGKVKIQLRKNDFKLLKIK